MQTSFSLKNSVLHCLMILENVYKLLYLFAQSLETLRSGVFYFYYRKYHHVFSILQIIKSPPKFSEEIC